MDRLESDKSEKKPLPVSVQDFQKLRQGDYYYVDKTRGIKTVMTEDSTVLLITRPRRFGKTLFMDTLARFLRFEAGRRNTTALAPEVLFQGLDILKDQAFCDAYMGKFPVVFVSLKGIYGKDFKEAYKKFVGKVFNVCTSYAYLLDSPRLTEWDKQDLRHCMDKQFLADPENQTSVQLFLQLLVKCLFKHHEQPVVLLIDEYDVPLAKAAAGGYYDDMINMIRPLLEEALKPDPNTDAVYLQKAVLTGCLRVSKESIGNVIKFCT